MFLRFWKGKKKIGLSMSGGGVKSLLYLGVINALQDHDIPIDIIGGLSGGALIAGLIGIGKTPAEIIAFTNHTNFNKLFDLNPLNGIEILDQKKVYEIVKGLVGDKRIEDCSPQVLIFATNLDTKQPEILTNGELASAMVSSCCLFPLMQPFERDQHELAEGGFSVYYGANYFRKLGANIVIGADVNGFSNMKLPKLISTFMREVSTLVDINAEHELALYPVDVNIHDFPDETGMFEFKKLSSKLVDIGYEYTLRFMPQIKKLVA